MEQAFVTILFAELAGSFTTRAGEAGDAVRRQHFALLREAIAEHGGREVRTTGDGLMVALPSAVAAVRCAMDMQRRTTAVPDRLDVRIGLDAGEPLRDGADLYGTPVIVAARLSELAEPGQILASEVVCRIAGAHVAEPMRPLAAFKVRGVEERVGAGQVDWAQTPEDIAAPEPVQRPIRTVIADDERLLRSGFRVILEAEPDVTIVGEAADGREAVAVVRRRRPDVVLMDVRMPELDGLRAAEQILADPDLGTAVVMLTTFDRDEYIYEALRVGASGFLLKDAHADRLIEAVRVAAAGDAMLAPSVTRRMIERFALARAATEAVPRGLDELTPRELEILRLVAAGLSNAEIAADLVLGENTVKTHVAHVLSKLGLRDRVQAVVLAYESRLVVPGAREPDR